MCEKVIRKLGGLKEENQSKTNVGMRYSGRALAFGIGRRAALPSPCTLTSTVNHVSGLYKVSDRGQSEDEEGDEQRGASSTLFRLKAWPIVGQGIALENVWGDVLP